MLQEGLIVVGMHNLDAEEQNAKKKIADKVKTQRFISRNPRCAARGQIFECAQPGLASYPNELAAVSYLSRIDVTNFNLALTSESKRITNAPDRYSGPDDGRKPRFEISDFGGRHHEAGTDSAPWSTSRPSRCYARIRICACAVVAFPLPPFLLAHLLEERGAQTASRVCFCSRSMHGRLIHIYGIPAVLTIFRVVEPLYMLVEVAGYHCWEDVRQGEMERLDGGEARSARSAAARCSNSAVQQDPSLHSCRTRVGTAKATIRAESRGDGRG
jgi:hypothetical protein